MIPLKAVDRRREGRTAREQCRLVQLYLLDVLAELCERHHLRYFLTGGSLIGAMRHDGFIPWDDDLDIAMPAEDFRRFRRIARGELPAGVMLQTPGGQAGAIEGFAKLRDLSSFYCESHTHVQGPCGISIDIFPYIRFPVLPRRFSRFLTRWCHHAWVSASVHLSMPHRTAAGMALAALKAAVWKAGYYTLAAFCHALALVLPTVRHDPLATPHVAQGPAEIPEQALFPLGEHVFEGKVYRIPHDPDAVLTQHYGDWRQLPPESERHIHAGIVCPLTPPPAPWARPLGGD